MSPIRRLRNRRRTLSPTTAPGSGRSRGAAPTRQGLRFKEQMRGWVNLAGRDPFSKRDDSDALTLEEHSSRIVLSLTPELDDVARFVEDGAWPLRATGTVEIATLSLVLQANGTMRLAVPASDRDQGTTMEYELECRAPGNDSVFIFSGRKYVRDNRGPFDIWSDTTRLDFVIYPSGHADVVVGHGSMRIGIGRLIRMVASMRGTTPTSPSNSAAQNEVDRLAAVGFAPERPLPERLETEQDRQDADGPERVDTDWAETDTAGTDGAETHGAGAEPVQPRQAGPSAETEVAVGAPGAAHEAQPDGDAGPDRRAGRLRPQIRFAKAFNSHVLGEFGGLLNHGAEFRKLAATPPLPLPPTWNDPVVEHWYAAGPPPQIGDGLDAIEWTAEQASESWLGLHRFRGGGKGPILLAAGYGMTSDSFAARVGPTDLMTYLTTRGYDVWLFDYRQSFRLPSHDSHFTMDEIALVDWPAAVAEVRRRTGADSVLIFAHCMGSLTAFMSLLAGLPGVRAFVSSQVTAHVTMPGFSRLKAKFRVPTLMSKVGLNTVGPPRGVGMAERVWDLLMRPYPWLKGEQCHNPACRWVASVYGPTHLHTNLSAAAHSQIGNMFGSAAVTPVAQITAIVRAGHLVDAQGRDVYMGRPDRLDLPIAFLRGTDNKIFTEPGPLKTISWLRRHNPDQDYQWIGLDGFGHLDSIIGRDSERRVFDKMLPFLEAYAYPNPSQTSRRLTRNPDETDRPRTSPRAGADG